jgi:hypothetical protein
VRAARFVPFLTVSEEASPWFPMAGKQILVLYATGNGYLAESVAEGAARPRAGGAPAGDGPPGEDREPVAGEQESY